MHVCEEMTKSHLEGRPREVPSLLPWSQRLCPERAALQLRAQLDAIAMAVPYIGDKARTWWQSHITWVYGVMNDLKFSHLKKRNYACFSFFSFLFCAEDYMHLSARNCLNQIWPEVLWLFVLKDFSIIMWCWSRLDRTICDGLTSCHLYSGLLLRNLEWRSDETSLCVSLSEEHVKKGFSIARRVSCCILTKLSRHLSNKGEMAHWIPCTFATCYISNRMYNIRAAITFWPISDHGSQFGFKLIVLGEGRLKQKSWRRL